MAQIECKCDSLIINKLTKSVSLLLFISAQQANEMRKRTRVLITAIQRQGKFVKSQGQIGQNQSNKYIKYRFIVYLLQRQP